MPKRRPAFTPHLTPVDDGRAAPMSANEFNRVIDKLGLTQQSAARLLDINPRTVRHWAAGDYAVLPPAARFLRYLAKAKISPIEVMETLAS
jgi:DNA-binding transcriptional regulator YiaG